MPHRQKTLPSSYKFLLLEKRPADLEATALLEPMGIVRSKYPVQKKKALTPCVSKGEGSMSLTRAR